MVGKELRIMESLARYTSKIIGRPYRLGGSADARGADCFSSIWDYLFQRLGPEKLPEQYEGLTMNTYADLYKEDPEQAKCIMIRLMKDLLHEIHPNKAAAGDILRLECKLGDDVEVVDFLAIDVGNGKFIMATESRGLVIWPKRFYKVRAAWRCHDGH